MVYNITVNAKYNENCDYTQSEVQKKIPIANEPQPVILNAHIENPSIEIGEELKIIVSCKLQSDETTPIKSGYITINNLQTKCYLNNDGQAVIYYKPLKMDEKIKITYNDVLGLFDSNTISLVQPNHFSIKPITVNIQMEHPDIVSDFEQPVTINVHVTTTNNENVTYGRITFLHYLYYTEGTNENRMEKIIGNPVYLDENGYASITYSPMQDYREDADLEEELQDFYQDYQVEYIKAVYNYSKDSSSHNVVNQNDVTWQYYASNHTIGYIYLQKDNTIRLTGHQNDQEKSDLNIGDYIEYIESQDELLLKVDIILTDEDEIIFQEGDTIDLVIKGTTVSPKNTNFNYGNNYDSYVKEYYNYTEVSFTAVAEYNLADNTFYAVLSNLAPGYYDIYAKFDTLYGYKNDKKTYLKPIKESMHYYLQVKYNSNNDIQISFEKDVYETPVDTPIDIIVYINDATENQKAILTNKKCYLHLPSGDIKGIIIEDDSQLKVFFIDISFTSARNYSIYAYTKGMIQDNEYIPPLYTNNALIRVSGEIIPSINVNSKQMIYPGSIEYIVSVDNINNEIINGNVYNYQTIKNNPTTYTFDIFNDKYSNTINQLNAGTYRIDFDIDTGMSATQSYQITQASIDFDISDKLSRGIIAFPTQLASIVLSSNGKDLSNIDVNKLHIYIKPFNTDESHFKECNINDITFITNNNEIKAIVSFMLGEYTAGRWDIKIQYDTDENFTYVYRTLRFDTELLTPSYTISEDDDNNITIHIDNTQLEYIPLLIDLTDGSDIRRFIGVTDASGDVTLISPSDKTLWNNLNQIIITTNPTNTELITSILNIDNNNLNAQDIIYDNFEYAFYGKYANEGINDEVDTTLPDDENTPIIDDSPISGEEDTPNNEDIPNSDETSDDEIISDEPHPDDEETSISRDKYILQKLYNQLINYESTYLFTIYKEHTITYYR